jgi:hypothetical protein
MLLEATVGTAVAPPPQSSTQGHDYHVAFAADDPAQLSRADKLALLQRLRDAVKQMHAQLLLQPAQVLLAAVQFHWAVV